MIKWESHANAIKDCVNELDLCREIEDSQLNCYLASNFFDKAKCFVKE